MRPHKSKQVHTLANLGDVDGLLEVVERGEGKGACQAALALAELGEQRAVAPVLTRLRGIDLTSPLKDDVEQWSVLARALGALAEPESPAAKELLDAAEQRDGVVARSAIEALETMGEQRAVEPLLHRLQRIPLRSPASEADQVELETVAEALGTLGAARAVDPLIAALQVDEFFETAAYALGEIGDPRAAPVLIALLETGLSSWNENAVLVALEQIGTPEAKKAIAAHEA